MLWINKIKNFKLIVMFDIWLWGGCLMSGIYIC